MRVLLGLFAIVLPVPALAADTQGELGPEQVLYKQAENADGSAVELRLHVFKPAGWAAGDRRPCIVFFFGGGWNGGSPSQFYPHARALAARGMVAAAAEYRVRSRNGTPPQACVADGKSAVRYLREHADELGIDPEKVAAGGGSAGGHVAAATALVTGFDDPGDNLERSCVPNLLVLFNPVIDTTPNRGWGWRRLGEDAAAMSPVEGVHADQPPSVVFHGTADTTVPIESARLFKRLSDEAGAPCLLHEYEGAGHGFFNQRDADDPDAPRNAYYRDTMAKMVAFLEAHQFLRPAE